MESLYLLIPIALIFIIIVAALLIWSINRGQYDDLDNDAWRALNDDLSSKSAPKGDNDRN
ncbi:cbb3-type cytochrome oxidase assembly protein CcoS [Luminiphilus sp.]|nr:cbb3-type cytochrome oxidase assembly protein CcoS [Luminiphilus sp.]MDA7840299.1 cbb3-type cytochrome oxidase assembly protein CcoS [Luminiphilus sp.]MDA8827195.1 cbb3-type cytochrome oxidase assembly protein CcoS [Luminiphilus sp.]MDA9580210.1 cbb3-type cytochrome oxidase assembly protein CcoS [Luminiphilus sp.]MDB2352004.1 cbb3-type cytochrome oxidase assembly protein CcoS [Luminiphilus sp.]